jgi:hyperosmotically inducible protein
MKTVRTAGLLLALLALLAAACASGPEKRVTSQVYEDDLTTARVKRALLQEESVRLSDIDVATQRGSVRLAGFVSSAEALQAADHAARRVQGVKSVKNELHVKP